jgi:hypothetical protein
MKEDWPPIDFQIAQAMTVVTKLSCAAKAAGDLPTMYQANKAWHELDIAMRDLGKRLSALA